MQQCLLKFNFHKFRFKMYAATHFWAADSAEFQPCRACYM